MLRPVLSAAAVLFALVLPSAARASACCGGGRGIGQRLAPSEHAAALLNFRSTSRIGGWDASHSFFPPGHGSTDLEFRAELGWLVRPIQRLQLGFIIPALLNIRSTQRLNSSGYGLGDIQTNARFDIRFPDAPGPWPGLALTLSADIPTGTGPLQAKDPLQAQATGRDYAEVRPGIAFEKNWDQGFFAILAASVGFPTSFHLKDGTPIHSAPRVALTAAAGPSWSSGFSFSLGLNHERQAAPEIGGMVLDHASLSKTAVFLVSAYDVNARWTAFLFGELGLPISGLGQNETTTMAFSLGIRRAWGVLSL